MPDNYNRDDVFRRLWGWLTVDGASNPASTAPTASTQAIRPSTGTKSNVADTNVSTSVLAANTSRKAAAVWNDSTAILYLDLSGGTASATSCTVKIAADGYFEFPQPVYTGLVTGIWASDSTGSARVTEWT